MSRIGKKIIIVPDKVQVDLSGSTLKAKGPKGELSTQIPDSIQCNINGSEITFSRNSDDKKIRALHGLTRALSFNMIEGVSAGFSKTLGIEGVGYKAELRGDRILLSMGYSHPIVVIPPAGITFTLTNPTTIVISGIDKQLIGEVASKIRSIRPPEPYKGKGIRYQGEYIRRKAGKTAAK